MTRRNACSPVRVFLSCAGAAMALCLNVTECPALMAGRLPDSPAARVDPNTDGSAWRGVGSVVIGSAAYSGVAIARRYVLTAAHVVGSATPSQIRFVLNLATGQSVFFEAEAVTRFPSYSFPYDDLAVIRLNADLPGQVTLYPIFATPVATGQTVFMVGYGGSGNGDVGPAVGSSSTVKRRGRNTVDAIQATLDASGRTSTFYLYDFDGPTGNGTLGGRTLGNAEETGAAGGDSGSPVFVESGGIVWLMGINNFVAAPSENTPIDYKFGTLGGGMLLSDPRFMAWLRETTGDTLVSPENEAEVPDAPPWALALLAGVLAAGLYRSTRNRKTPEH